MDGIKGVYTTIDGHEISLTQKATAYRLQLPDGSEVDWQAAENVKRAPSVWIACRVAGGYSAPESLRAGASIPPQEFPARTLLRFRKDGGALWPDELRVSIDRALSALAEGASLEWVISKRQFPREEPPRDFVWALDFEADEGLARVVHIIVRHCHAR